MGAPGDGELGATDTTGGSSASDRATAREWLVGGGELGELIRGRDWSETAFGPREHWPQSLRTVVCLVTESRTAMALLWGPGLLLYNDAYRVIAAAKHPAALGRPTREVWPEVWHINEPLLAAVMERGESLFFEDRLFTIRREEGLEDAYFTIAYAPVRVEDGSIGGTLVTLQETTARVRSNAALRQAQGILAEGERLAQIGSFEYVPATETTVWSEGEYRIYGLDPAGPSPAYEELLTRFIHRDDARLVHERFSTALRSAAVYELTHRIVRPDGTVRWVRDRAQPYFDGSGRLVRYAGATLDVTEAKQAEAALRQSEERYRQIVENAEEGIWTIDTQARTTYANRRMAEMLGYTVGEMEGRSLFDFMDAGARATAARLLEKRRAGTRERHEFVFRRKDGGAIRAEIGASPIYGPDGRVEGALALVMDITQRRHAEEERDRATLDAAQQRGRMEAMKEADRRKNEFIAVLSHELRNPLAPVRAALYLLERAPAGSDTARRAQEVIGRQVGHMTHLVDDLLDVSRIARGRIELRRAPLDLAEVARRVVEDHRAPFAERGVGLELVDPSTPLPVLGDETRLSQAIANLLGNALKFTPPGGRASVRLGADPARREATVDVVDTGQGIAPEVLPSLFEPFAQADRSLDRSLGGLGLGLVLVKSLVELHGGSVAVASGGVGQGATFTLRLPLRSGLTAPSPAPRPEERAGSRRVLVIEDHADSAEILGEALGMLGHEVALAHDGVEGLAQARRFRPDVVLCDLGLPGMDGYAVARAMRADPALAHVRLVAHSGYAASEDLARVREAGFDAQLAKPADIASIEASIERVLAARGPPPDGSPAAPRG